MSTCTAERTDGFGFILREGPITVVELSDAIADSPKPNREHRSNSGTFQSSYWWLPGRALTEVGLRPAARLDVTYYGRTYRATLTYTELEPTHSAEDLGAWQRGPRPVVVTEAQAMGHYSQGRWVMFLQEARAAAELARVEHRDGVGELKQLAG